MKRDLPRLLKQEYMISVTKLTAKMNLHGGHDITSTQQSTCIYTWQSKKDANFYTQHKRRLQHGQRYVTKREKCLLAGYYVGTTADGTVPTSPDSSQTGRNCKFASLQSSERALQKSKKKSPDKRAVKTNRNLISLVVQIVSKLIPKKSTN